MKAKRLEGLKELVGTPAKESDAKTIITDYGVFRLEDESENVVHARLNYNFKAELLDAIQNCPAAGILTRPGTIEAWGKVKNSSELTKKVIQQSFTFGYRPALAFRQNYACSSAKANQDPNLYPLIKKLAILMDESYRKHSLEAYEIQKKYVSEIKPIWRIENTIFTSGIVNLDYNINYHHDAANWKDVHSAMLVLSGGHEGGRLILPKYETGLELKDNSVLIFNGGKTLHGVTPLHIPEGSHRISIVFYAMRGLCKCGSHEDEMKKFKETSNKIAFKKCAQS